MNSFNWSSGIPCPIGIPLAGARLGSIPIGAGALLPPRESRAIPQVWSGGSGLWTLDSGLWTLDSGVWTLVSGVWTLSSGPWPGRHGFSEIDGNVVIAVHWRCCCAPHAIRHSSAGLRPPEKVPAASASASAWRIRLRFFTGLGFGRPASKGRSCIYPRPRPRHQGIKASRHRGIESSRRRGTLSKGHDPPQNPVKSLR
jgi:hypothetical protein